MSAYWCGDCGGEMVSCECPEIDDDRDGPEEYDDEVVEDRNVIWTVGDNGVGRVEVVR
jgi:hypothetical protein